MFLMFFINDQKLVVISSNNSTLPQNNTLLRLKVIPPNAAYINQLLRDLAVNVAVRKLEIVGCAAPNAENPVLKLDSRDCALFCLGRGYEFVNLNPMTEKCFCSASIEKNYVCSSEKSYNFVSVRITERKAFKYIHSSSLGCFTSNTDVQKLFPAGNTLAFMTSEECVTKCSSTGAAMALYSHQMAKNSEMCHCAMNIMPHFNYLDDVETICSIEAFITPTGLQKCSDASLLDENQTKIKQIALMTVPGSGTTWTRLLFQSLTGILSGSVYRDSRNLARGLKGEMERWMQRKTTLIKTHDIGGWEQDVNGVKVPLPDIVDGFVLVLRNPLESTLAEFNRLSFGQVRGFPDNEAFKKRATIGSRSFDFLFKKQMKLFTGFVKRYTNVTKPVLFISYEDLHGNVLPQILRMASFFNISTDPTILERSICTVYSSKRIESLSKRKKNVDLVKLAASFINKDEAISHLKNANDLLMGSQMHYLRLSEYIEKFDL